MAFKDLTIQIRVIQRVRRELAAARDAIAQFDKEVRGIQGAKVAQTGKEYEKMAKGVDKAATSQKKLTSSNKKSAKTFQTLEKDVGKANKQMGQIPKVTNRAAAGMDTLKSETRLTAAGFVAMLKSQAAWIAGFAIIFGTLAIFTSLLREAVDIQNQWARSVRVLTGQGRSDISDLGEAYSAMTGQMLRTGSTAAEVNEVLYQLGSAGLFVDEAVAALNSSMDTLIGTEADLTQVTKLVAGVYNNMKLQMYAGADGVVRFSTDLAVLNNPMNQQITLTEKMVAINDALVWTWKDNQVEMDEVNNGLKYAIATSNAAGVSLTELLSVLAVLNNRLIKSGIAGRSFQSMMSRIAKQPMKFAEAFDIDIDPSKPLDLLDILKQVNKEMSKGNLTVAELGKIYDRLGLRGAKTFIVLLRNVKELGERMEEFSDSAQGASKSMADIMLNTPERTFARARQALVLLVDVMTRYLVNGVIIAVKGFNALAERIHKTNMAMGGWVGTAAKISFFVGVIGALVTGMIALAGSVPVVAAVFGALGAALLFIAPWIAAIIAGIVVISAVGYGISKLVKWFKGAGDGAKVAAKEIKTFAEQTDEAKEKLMGYVAGAAALIVQFDELSGIELAPNMDAYVTAESAIDVINQHIKQSLFYRKATLGDIQAINDVILKQAKGERDSALLGLDQMDLEKAKKEEIKAAIDSMTKATEKYNKALETSVKQAGAMADFTIDLSKFEVEFDFSQQMISAVAAGAGGTEQILQEFYTSLETLSREKISIVTSSITTMFDKFKDGEVTLREFQTLWGEYSAAASGAMSATIENISSLDEKLKTHKIQIQDLVIEYALLGKQGVDNLRAIDDAFGLGVSSMQSSLSEIKKNEKAMEKLNKEIRDGTDALDKLQVSGAGYDEINEALVELYKKQDDINQLESESSLLRSKNEEIIKRTTDLLDQEKSSIEDALSVTEMYADKMLDISENADISTDARIEALKKERAYVEEQTKHFLDLAKNESAQVQNLLDAGTIAEEEAYRKRRSIREELATKTKAVNERMREISKDRMQLELQLYAETEQRQKKEILYLEQLRKDYEALSKKVKEKVGKEAFEPLVESAKKAYDQIMDLADELTKLNGKKIHVEIIQDITTDKKQYGGLIGSPLFTRVSSGEGFIPPSVAKQNMGALSALNQGSVTPSAKGIDISRFSGPSGVDNIKTVLPQGSFVVSRKGMQAYDNAVSERERFQMGGMVGGTDGVNVPGPEEDEETTARFDLVLRVDGEEQRYPLYGPKSTIDDLGSELEKRNLTRL